MATKTHSAETMRLLDEQCRAYGDMFEVGKKQRACIEQQDYEALEQAFSEMHRLMDEVRLRQQRLPDLDASEQAVELRIERMRDWLLRLQDQRTATQSLAEEMLRLNREEFRQIGRGRRAARGYKTAPATGARLYDGTR